MSNDIAQAVNKKNFQDSAKLMFSKSVQGPPQEPIKMETKGDEKT